jgi:hypothetical protein
VHKNSKGFVRTTGSLKKLAFWTGSIAVVLFSFPRPMAAGCKSDCQDTYQSAIEDCHLLHDTADEADDLKMCIDDAKDEFDNCKEECDS